MKKSVVIAGGVLILFAVILGAMGAHALKDILTDKNMLSFETGVRYQMYMGLAILTLGLNYSKFRKKSFKLFLGFILTGSLLFSLSIYGLVWADTVGASLKKVFGPITPLGGVLMIIGWILFIVQFFVNKEES
jgi:uncharacterized membrane protein YgdD (TMEM256/DUF423 family)